MAVFRYPLRKLENAEDYIQIDILDYVPPGLGLGAKGSEVSFGSLPSSDDTYRDLLKGYDNVQNIRCSVILPIGNSPIGDSLTVGWGPDKRNPLQAAALNLAGGVLNEGLKETYRKGFSGARKLLDEIKSATGQRAISSAFAGAAVNALVGGDINSVISRETGTIFNPNIELLFSQVNLRGPFNFSFDMIPRFQKESDEVRRIIREFKQSMSPRKNSVAGGNGKGSGILIRSPHVFRLRYMSGGRIHPYLNRFKICALTNMDVNYNAAGPYSTYSDGTPVQMKMSLSFQELTPIYAEDYNEGQGRGGTGY
jgi:hypothetical protein